MLKRFEDFPKVTVILRGYTYESVRSVVKSMENTKLKAVEITLNTEGALTTIRKIAEEFGGKVCVGAGTVLNFDEAKASIEAGAKFILSPICLDKEVIEYCHEHDVICVPAAFTPSEIHRMFQYGADIVKIFPAGRLEPKFFSDIQAPLGRMPLMVVGGINVENVQQYFSSGVEFTGIGSGIFKKEDIISGDIDRLKKSIEEFEKKVDWSN